MAAKSKGPSSNIYAVLDANVLLPPRLSDVLFDMQGAGLYKARWSYEIEEEFKKNWASVVDKQGLLSPEATEAGATRRLRCYRGAAPEYPIMGHLSVKTLARVPSEVNKEDKHVAAAAIQLRTVLTEEQEQAIVYLVSDNLKHLAAKDMAHEGVRVVSPGTFIDLFANDARLEIALRQTIKELQNPPYSRAQLLGALLVHKAKKAVAKLATTWGVQPTGKPAGKKKRGS